MEINEVEILKNLLSEFNKEELKILKNLCVGLKKDFKYFKKKLEKNLQKISYTQFMALEKYTVKFEIFNAENVKYGDIRELQVKGSINDPDTNKSILITGEGSLNGCTEAEFELFANNTLALIKAELKLFGFSDTRKPKKEYEIED